MTKLHIPAEVLEKMVCLTCKHYLSIFPIYTKNDSSGAICGRCKVIDLGQFIKDEAYEGIAQYLLFPCMYSASGCTENLTPLMLEDHEKCCRFRKFDCPSTSYSKCEWQGSRSELVSHFQIKHPNILLTNASFEFNFVNSHDEKMLLSKEDQLFIVKKEVDARKGLFICTVQHLRSEEEDQTYNYFLRVMSADKNYHYRTSEKSTKEEHSTKLLEDLLKDKLHDSPSFFVYIDIVKPKDSQEMDTEMPKVPVPELKKSEKVNWDLIRELECPVCLEYMQPPVFQCNYGHSICQSCKKKIIVCPSCKVKLEAIRNFSLEKMIQRMEYPCKHHKSGCDYSCQSTNIAEHEKSCQYGPYDCPMKLSLGCLWNSDDNSCKISDHIEKNHAESILKTERVDVPFSKDEPNVKVYLIKFSKKCFKLVYKYENETFYWDVQLVGPSEFTNQYRFELDTVDLSGNKRRCYLTGLVSPLADEAFQYPDKFIVVPLEQVQSFIKDVFSFRIRIIQD